MINFARAQMTDPRGLVLEMRHVTSHDAGGVFLQDVTFDVQRGEIVTLFGPARAETTAALRIAAGLDRANSGEVYLSDQLVDNGGAGTFATPLARNVGIVLQSYAIWPHMTAAANVAYPLTVRKRKGPEVRERVAGLLEQVGLGGFEQRPASQLNPREQLLLAIARSLAVAPDVVLLDDPLSGLDTSARDGMRADLRMLQRKLGVAMLIATGSEIEALSLSDRVVVLDGGRVRQIGPPTDLYRRPGSEDVRDRIGRSVTFTGRIEGLSGAGCRVRLLDDDGPVVRAAHVHGEDVEEGRECLVSVRPEAARVVRMQDLAEADSQDAVRGIIAALLFAGNRYEATIELAGGDHVRLDLPLDGDWREGQPIAMRLTAADLHVWPQAIPQPEPRTDEAPVGEDAPDGEAAETPLAKAG